MSEPTSTDKLIDLFLLRVREPDYVTDAPYYTTGSIITAALMRMAIVVLAGYALRQVASATTTWTVMTFALWALVAWPAYNQYVRFNKTIDTIKHNTLCGVCRHFNPTNQLCTVLDEHVTSEAPPCDGLSWEPRAQ
jgi:hypothetical protein